MISGGTSRSGSWLRRTVSPPQIALPGRCLSTSPTCWRVAWWLSAVCAVSLRWPGGTGDHAQSPAASDAHAGCLGAVCSEPTPGCSALAWCWRLAGSSPPMWASAPKCGPRSRFDLPVGAQSATRCTRCGWAWNQALTDHASRPGDRCYSCRRSCSSGSMSNGSFVSAC